MPMRTLKMGIRLAVRKERRAKSGNEDHAFRIRIEDNALEIGRGAVPELSSGRYNRWQR